MMNNFVTLDAVMNYLTDTVKNETSPVQIKSWAYNFYKTNDIGESLEKIIVRLKVNNSTVILPDDIVKINGVYADLTVNNTYENEDIVEQYITYDDVIKENPMYYVGQNSKCILEYTCNNCQYMFSLNSNMTELTTDYTGDYIYVVYQKHVTTDGEISIPDDTYLLSALANYVEYMFWKNNLHKHENNAINIMNFALMQANSNMKAYRSSKLMKNLRANRLIASVNKRFKYEIVK